MAESLTEVTVYRTDLANPRFTPRELRLIREQTGRTLSAILTDEESDEKFIVFGWLKLRRDGHEITLEDMDDVVLHFVTTEEAPAADPTNGRPSATSPPSVATGA